MLTYDGIYKFKKENTGAHNNGFSIYGSNRNGNEWIEYSPHNSRKQVILLLLCIFTVWYIIMPSSISTTSLIRDDTTHKTTTRDSSLVQSYVSAPQTGPSSITEVNEQTTDARIYKVNNDKKGIEGTIPNIKFISSEKNAEVVDISKKTIAEGVELNQLIRKGEQDQQPIVKDVNYMFELIQTTLYHTREQHALFKSYLLNPSSPHHRALTFIKTEIHLQHQKRHSDERILQRYMLAIFYYSTMNEVHQHCCEHDFVNSNKHECKWNFEFHNGKFGGASCDNPHYPDTVTRLDFEGMELTGSIPFEIKGLTKLEFLSLSNNKLGGSIPYDSITSMTDLSHLFLSKNRLTGPAISSSHIGKLVNLRALFIDNNNLSGTIPKSLGSLTLLDKLSIHHNRNLTGVINDMSNICANLKDSPMGRYVLEADCAPTLVPDLQNTVKYSIVSIGGIRCGCCTKCFPER